MLAPDPFTRLVCAALLISWIGTARAGADGLSVTPHDEAVPGAISEAIKTRVASGGVRVTAGDTTLDFWWVQTLPTKQGTTASSPTWSDIEEGTLVGAVRISSAYSDIRGRTIKPGVYTLRYGIQPADGDHMGVSDFRDFLLLVPANLDTSADAIAHDRLVQLSGRAVGSSHPAVWSLDPPAAKADPLAVSANPHGHQGVIFEVPAGPDATGRLRFGLILVGQIEA